MKTYITKKQKLIFNNHVEAWKTKSWDISGDIVPSKEQLEDNLTSQLIWDVLMRGNVSVTSQLMASDGVFGHLSHSAQKAMRNGFKSFLNNLNIK